MHMADALVSPAVATTMYIASGAVGAYSLNRIKKEEVDKKVSLVGVMGAFVFATQMVNFTIPGTGSSGHLCGGLLLSAILGPFYGFISMAAILAIQCLLFADGGLMALGANIFNMAFYGCFVSYFLIYKPLTKTMNKKNIVIASILGSIVSLELGAFSVTIETLLSGITDLPFTVFAGAMLPIHLAIGFVEGLITSAVLLFVYDNRPEILTTTQTNKKTFKETIIILSIIVTFIAGGMSLLASSNPDGLEWSIERLTGDTELEADETIFDKVIETTSLLPDYAFKDNDSIIGTTFSGIVGSAVVCGLLVVAANTLNKKNEQHQ